MSIRKRGKTYLVDVKVRSRRIRRTAGTKSEARELEYRLRQRLSQGPEKGLDEALLNYLEIDARALRDQKGLKTNAKALRPFIEGRTLDEAPDIAQAMKREWIKDLKPATINRRLALLRRLCNLAFEWGWTDKAIGKRIKLLPGETARHVYLSPGEVEAIAAKMPLAGDLVRFTAYTGLRLGEVMGLGPDNVLDDAVVLYDTKNSHPRVVPVPDRVKPLLDAIPWKITETVRRNEWEAARKAVGLAHVHWHDLRHTYASWLAAKGVSDRKMGELLGHRSAQMVRRYAHLRAEALRDEVADL